MGILWGIHGVTQQKAEIHDDILGARFSSQRRMGVGKAIPEEIFGRGKLNLMISEDGTRTNGGISADFY